MATKEPRIPVSTRLRLTDMATVTRFLSERGVPVKNQSELCHLAVQMLAENIESVEGVVYTDAEVSLRYLNNLGFGIKTRDGSRQAKSVTKSLQFDALAPPGARAEKLELQRSFNLLQEKLGLTENLPAPAPDFSPPVKLTEKEDD